MKYKYCPICGRELIEKYSWDEGGVPYCEHDNMMYFDTPKPCIIVAVVKGNEVLLLKQSYIFKDSKVLVSGYVTNGETVEDTVSREVLEETGIEIEDMMYLGSYYLSAKEIIMLTYVCKYKSGEIIKSDEVEGIGWEKLDNAISKMKQDDIGKAVMTKVLQFTNMWNDETFKYVRDVQNS